MGIIDVIIIALILISAFAGYKKGLVSLGIHLVAFILALLITLIIYRPIGNIIINTTGIDEAIQETIQKNIETLIQTEVGKEEVTNELIEITKNGALPGVAQELAYNVVYVGTMIGLFILLRICLMLINTLANAISKLPFLNQVNKVGGIIYGIVRGVIITYLALLIISLISVVNPQNSIIPMIDNTYLAKMMMQNNILNIWNIGK